jgi:hypothetical protein
MKEEKERAKAEARAKRLAGPQALVPGVVSNTEESAFTLVMIVITIFSLWGVDTYNMQVNNPLDPKPQTPNPKPQTPNPKP